MQSNFENTALRRIFRPKREEVRGEWKSLHNEELYDFFSSPNIIRVIKPRRVRLAGHVARIGSEQVHTAFFGGNLSERSTWKTQWQIG